MPPSRLPSPAGRGDAAEPRASAHRMATGKARKNAVCARILYFGNAGPTPEAVLAREIVTTGQLFRISDDYTAYIDDSREFYNVLFVVGSDPVRIRKFMRIYRDLLKTKAKIALVRDARPAARAQILNTGFDDVFGAEISPVEGLARIHAILGRIVMRQQEETLGELAELHLQHYAVQPLLGREARLLAMLVSAKGSPVRSQQLATSSKSTHRQISIKSLQVLVSGLRTKLKPHLQIVSHGPSGYALVDVSPVHRLIDGAAGRLEQSSGGSGT